MSSLNKREIAKLACRILSLYTIVKAISLVFMSLYGYDWATFLQYSLPFVLLFAAGVVLWLAAERLASAMVADFNEPEARAGFSAADAQMIAFSTLGLFLMAAALPELISSIGKIIMADAMKIFDLKMTSAVVAIQHAVEFLIGLGLFGGAGGLVKIFQTLRQAGYREENR